jgi:hypothetical protein
MGKGWVGVTFCQVLCLCKTEAKVSCDEPEQIWPYPLKEEVKIRACAPTATAQTGPSGRSPLQRSIAK